MGNLLRSKEYWQVVSMGIEEPTTGVVLTEKQKTYLEGLKLKDLKVKNYLSQVIDCLILKTVLCKETSKQIQDPIKKKYKGSTRTKRQQLQGFRSELKTLRMISGELVMDYFSRMMAIANKMRIHGNKMIDITIIKKILPSMTLKFNYVVCFIEESKDLDELSIDKLQGFFLVHEKKYLSIKSKRNKL